MPLDQIIFGSRFWSRIWEAGRRRAAEDAAGL